MTSGFFPGNLFRGLAFRVLFFLSLTLLPIGLLAISQTQQLAQQNRESAELALLSMTEKASAAERSILQEAISAGEALASTISLFNQDDAACSLFLREYQQSNAHYIHVGYVQRDGEMRCSSANKIVDFAGEGWLENGIEVPRWRVWPRSTDAETGISETVVSGPVVEGDKVIGLMTLSIPIATFLGRSEEALEHRPIAQLTFNAAGDLILAEKARNPDSAFQEEPVSIAQWISGGDTSAVFQDQNLRGRTRVYVAQEIVTKAAFAVTVWPADTPLLNPSLATRLSTQLPIVMWLASLVVSFWALNRLAIRHIRKLGRQMRRFGLNRKLPQMQLGSGVPTELVEMESAFVSMGESILRDEAVVEDSLREKNILLKEVHHRVKNNLQLISSIMNMQIRQAKTEDARRVLMRLQERILGLATVHKTLYQNDTLVRVDAEGLLREIVNQALLVGLAPGSNVKVTQEYQAISLEADDAAPLTLLVSEAITNALKYVRQDGLSDAWIAVSLEAFGEDRAMLNIRNTTGGAPEHEGTGLGTRLIDAFTRQLNGQVDAQEEAGVHTLRIHFPVPKGQKQIYDY